MSFLESCPFTWLVNNSIRAALAIRIFCLFNEFIPVATHANDTPNTLTFDNNISIYVKRTLKRRKLFRTRSKLSVIVPTRKKYKTSGTDLWMSYKYHAADFQESRWRCRVRKLFSIGQFDAYRRVRDGNRPVIEIFHIFLSLISPNGWCRWTHETRTYRTIV